MRQTLYYKGMRAFARALFPKSEMRFETEPPDEPIVLIGNHSSVRGPIMLTLDDPRPHRTWAIHSASDRAQAASYAYHDIFFGNSRRVKWFWRIPAAILGVALPPLLIQSGTIPVYHDSRILSTLRESIRAMQEGSDIVIFAESPVRYSEYVNELQPGFTDLARLWYKKTGKRLAFYPFYAEKKNRVIAVGKPIVFDPDLPAHHQQQIAEYLRDEIDRLGRSLPPHTPVPFLPPLWYRGYAAYEHAFLQYWLMIEHESKKDPPA